MKHRFHLYVRLLGKRRTEAKLLYSVIRFQHSGRMKHGDTAIKGTSPLPGRPNFSYPECIHFKSVCKDFLVSVMCEWTNWMEIRKQDNFFGKFPSVNLHF